MAWTGNFKDQIDNLAGTLTVTDDDAIQQWILDGCYDVKSKILQIKGPEEIWKFSVKSSNQSSNNIDIDEIRDITGVVVGGAVATQGTWTLKAKYADSGSIYYAGAGAPIWYLDDSKLSIFPAPTGSNIANYYYIPEYTITNWNSSTSSINNFPSEYYYNVMLYTSLQVLQRRMLDFTIADLTLTPVPPDIPTISSTSVASFGTVPAYDETAINSVLTSIDAALDDEDVELSTGRIAEGQMIVQNELNAFNEANAVYQANIQEAIKNADLDNAEDSRKLQLYTSELSSYQAEINASIQEFSNNLAGTKTDYEWIKSQHQLIMAQYQLSFGIPQNSEEVESYGN